MIDEEKRTEQNKTVYDNCGDRAEKISGCCHFECEEVTRITSSLVGTNVLCCYVSIVNSDGRRF